MPEYFQLARNLSGSRSGVLLLAVTLSAVGAWVVAGRLRRRLPETASALVGLALLVAGLAILVSIGAHSRWAPLIAGLGLIGAGLGGTAATVRALPGFGRSSLSAVLAGAALGLAGAGAAFQFAQADKRGSGATFEGALAAGVGWAALFLLVVVASAVLAVWPRGGAPKPASSEARPAAGS
jgi:hypothetical protein